MPTLHIKGSTDAKGVFHGAAIVDSDCQTCHGTFDITIPYAFGQPKTITVTVNATAPGAYDKPPRDITVK
jgi:hypothetical protein